MKEISFDINSNMKSSDSEKKNISFKEENGEIQNFEIES